MSGQLELGSNRSGSYLDGRMEIDQTTESDREWPECLRGPAQAVFNMATIIVRDQGEATHTQVCVGAQAGVKGSGRLIWRTYQEAAKTCRRESELYRVAITQRVRNSDGSDNPDLVLGEELAVTVRSVGRGRKYFEQLFVLSPDTIETGDRSAVADPDDLRYLEKILTLFGAAAITSDLASKR